MNKKQFSQLIKECMKESILIKENRSPEEIEKTMKRVSDNIGWCEDKDDFHTAGILKKEYRKLEAELKLATHTLDEKDDDIAGLGGGAESDAEEDSIKVEVLKVVDKVVKEYQGGLAIDKKEMEYAAQEEETDVKRLFLADVLFERVKNILYNKGQSKHSTFVLVNKPMVKDAIIVKLGSNPMASTVATGSSSTPFPANVNDKDEPPVPSAINEGIKKGLKKLIKEALEEVKAEKKTNNTTIVESVFNDVIKPSYKDAVLYENAMKNFEIKNCGSHFFDIRPMWSENFNVVYFKDAITRERKFNLNEKLLKEYIKSKLDDNLNYMTKEYNKSADNNEGKGSLTKKIDGRPVHNPIKLKKVLDAKNEEKNYTVQAVTNEADLPNKPLAEVTKITKQSDHPITGEKAKYTYPKQEKGDKKHLVKLKNKKLKSK